MNIYLVGGSVRDHMLHRTGSKDYDFAVEAPSYEAMREELLIRGARFWKEDPKFVTLRCCIPRENLGEYKGLLKWGKMGLLDADFTLCRAEAMYSDQRHPDVVTPAGLLTDLSRRDFTINAVAMSEDGVLIDPYHAHHDILLRRLRCVGNPADRFREDPLRILRALRFAVKYKLSWSADLHAAMQEPAVVNWIGTLPVERVRDELTKTFAADWYETILYLGSDFSVLTEALNRHFSNLWFKPTTEDR